MNSTLLVLAGFDHAFTTSLHLLCLLVNLFWLLSWLLLVSTFRLSHFWRRLLEAFIRHFFELLLLLEATFYLNLFLGFLLLFLSDFFALSLLLSLHLSFILLHHLLIIWHLLFHLSIVDRWPSLLVNEFLHDLLKSCRHLLD